jgi:hypothetical protein
MQRRVPMLGSLQFLYRRYDSFPHRLTFEVARSEQSVRALSSD